MLGRSQSTSRSGQRTPTRNSLSRPLGSSARPGGTSPRGSPNRCVRACLCERGACVFVSEAKRKMRMEIESMDGSRWIGAASERERA